MGHCSSYSAISRDWVGKTGWELRHRTGYYSSGRGRHGGRHSEHFNKNFHGTCTNWAKNLNFFSTNYIGGAYTVTWVGDVGVGVCKSGYHGRARAFDLTHIRFSNGAYFDANWSWRESRYHHRRYLAVAAQCRRYVGTVLTHWYNSAHADHIHFDNGVGATYIRSGAKSDTTLVQASCNLLNGESLAVDGVWGSLTQSAYRRLIRKFNMGCYDPRSNASHAKVFLAHIVKHGFANKSAGYYKSSC